MSHKSEVKTTITDVKYLKETISGLGYGFEDNQKLVSKYDGVDGVDVDIRMDMNGKKQLGFSKTEDGTYQFVGDFYGLGNQDKFIKSFLQKYAAVKVRAALKKKGWSITETNANGKIKLVVNL